jgi:hypothetical protein
LEHLEKQRLLILLLLLSHFLEAWNVRLWRKHLQQLLVLHGLLLYAEGMWLRLEDL